MPYSLQGRRVLVTGASRGLGALVCRKFAAEGCNIAINYHSNEAAAQELARELEVQFSISTCIIPGDAAVDEENVRLVKETVERLGGLDIVIANAGWTRFSKVGDIYDLSNDEWNRCWQTNVMSHLQLMQEAAPIMKANPDGGVYLLTSSIASISTMGSSVAYSVTKAAGLHLMKNFAFSQGPKIRVNAVLPGLLLTEWGQNYGDEMVEIIKSRSALKHETYLDDCADAFVTLAKNNSVTGQAMTVDAGLVVGTL